MVKNSQDLELLEIEAKVRTEQQKLTHLQAAVKAEQEKSADLKSQNDKDFEILRELSKKKLSVELKEAKQELLKVQKSVKSTQEQADANFLKYEAQIKPLETTISELNLQKD